jgi:glycolate oxidase FAD binding subunit
MTVSAPALAEALGDIVGRESVIADAAVLAAHAIDGARPRWVVRPASGETAARVLALAHAERLAVAPRGSGSTLGLGWPPARLDLVLDCRGLDGVIDYTPEDMVLSVGAGASLGSIAARLAPHRQRLPIDPPGGQGRTIGGVLATAATGPLRFRHGAGRDLLLGVRFVQADGTLTWGGARVVKSVTGYDVPKLLTGSLGTLGVLVETTLRVHPLPPARRSWLFPFTSYEAASAFVARVLDSTVEPTRLAVLSADAARETGLGEMAAAVAISVESVDEAVASQGEALITLGADEGSQGMVLTDGFWERAGEVVLGPFALKLAAEPRNVAHWLAALEAAARGMGRSMAAMAEAGSGIILAALGADTDAARFRDDVLVPLRAGLVPEGGSLVVERAPAAAKAVIDPWGAVSPEALEIMRRLKAEFDPRGVLNPGRFVGGV